MIKHVLAGIAFFAHLSIVSAQQNITVEVRHTADGRPLPGVSVRLDGTIYQGQTDASGKAVIRGIHTGTYTVAVSHLGYAPQARQVTVPVHETIHFSLERAPLLTDEVVVQATRAAENTATTYKNVSKADIAKNNLGQDIPYLLDQTPGVVISSDAGAGIGYTSMRIRGSDGQRTNVTINGIPLNDAESLGSFFINLPDFASSIENIQIQRGVGTSTNGAGAFGASLNIQTNTLNEEAYAELDNSFGSYNSWKNTLRLGTGLIDGQYSFDGRLSRIQSDGYIDRAASDLQSFFLSGAWHGRNSLLRANVFGGREKTYQAWYGTPESRLTGDVDAMRAYAADDGLTEYEIENLLRADRRYNKYLYDNETDNYQQTHYQLLFSSALHNRLTLNTALHYTRGKGYYEQFRDNDAYADYGLQPIEVNEGTVAATDLVRQRWLDNHFYGATYSLVYDNTNGLELTWGGAYNEYKGGHYGDIVWSRHPLFSTASYSPATSGSFTTAHRYYDGDATKKDFNTYLKALYQLNNWSFFADVQYRYIDYAITGIDNDLRDITQDATFGFFNPKAGLTYQLSTSSNVYASYAMANKEPVRSDFTDWPVGQTPKPERLHNIEAGYRLRTPRFNVGLNGYAMLYKNQLVLTGQLNDVGTALRTNVDDSYRIGLEFDGRWAPVRWFTWGATLAYSQNKIKDFTEVVGDVQNFYQTTDISFSPDWVASNELSFYPWDAVELALLSKYVSRQYLDNTGNKSRSIDGFFVNHLRLGYQTAFWKLKQVGLTLLVNNVFNEKYAANGYTWGYYLSETDRVDYNFYYPQATTNFLLGLHVRF
ncbi:iron complex outermembrane recepter protein [Parapedobacter composti]|uniref:Iron complex outermembrane recepter protein n=1 Tax=Parapedobacter composti TaxID=623281 RepID=A0A1I1JKQ7_9SPHI|nr:TonB-dependent receptor [Parapedobacter composti]SFC46040.1 iron complex outermembrane recepter protein [Parapedobacter composti]